MRKLIILLLFAIIGINFTNADFGYNVWNGTCPHDGTGGGGRNGFTLGNIGYGGCWINDPNSGIVFLPCNPTNVFTTTQTLYDNTIVMKPIFNGTAISNNASWMCYDWTGVDTNALVDIRGNLIVGLECNPNNRGTFKAGKLYYNINCGFAGSNRANNTWCQLDDLGQNQSCAPIDCEPLMLTSTIFEDNPSDSNGTNRYYCRDFLVNLVPMVRSSSAKPLSDFGLFKNDLTDYYGRTVLPTIYSSAYNQSSGKILTTDIYTKNVSFGPWYNLTFLPLTKTLPILTPSNIHYEVSQICFANGINYATSTDSSTHTVYIGDWTPIYISTPPVTPAWNNSVIGNLGTSLSLDWEATWATTGDNNICRNPSNIFNQIDEEPKRFLKDPLKYVVNAAPDWVRNGINLIAFFIDMAFVALVAWLLFKVIKNWLDLRTYLYQRKPLLCIIPGIRYVGWAVGTLLAYSIILQNEMAFKIAAIFAGIHWLFGINADLWTSAIIGAASIVFGFLPAYFYQVAIILATLFIGMTIFILLYDAYLIYLKRLAYPRLK